MCISRFIGFDELDKKLSDVNVDFVPYISESDLFSEIKNLKPSLNISLALTLYTIGLP